ncbi:transposable element Tcb2 transposase [Trichonephila clavipes]|nr:transposable element Tcb2 transposase [Trichonephila clavipes]
MTGHIYRDVIVEQHVRLFRGAMGAEFLFMDDNACPHRANIVDECLQSEDITCMDWPAYSPDFNLIEHVWDMLGRRIAARQPPPTCLPELWRALLDERCNIPEDRIDNLIACLGVVRLRRLTGLFFNKSFGFFGPELMSPGLVPNIRIDVVQNTTTDFAQLKAALSKAFPAIQNRKDLETRFYASQQRQNQEPTDFVYDLLKLNKKLELGISEKVLVDHIFVRLESQVQDYVEVRNPQTAIQLLEVLAKFEERYSCKATLGSRNSNNVEGRGWNERRISNVSNNRGNWRNAKVERRPNNGRNDYRGSQQNNRQGNQWFESRNTFQNDDRRFNDRGYQFRNRGQNDDFSRGDQRNRGSSENFSRGSRKQMGRLNVLKVSDINPLMVMNELSS